ncbi:MAG: high frequency lysogenization protein HflD [Thioalkalispiraceae bacterium]|jgi:high frequency lysogenization protein
MRNLHDKTLALAAVFQSAKLVKDVATTGSLDQHDMQTIISAIFDINPSSAESVYGSVENLRTGLQNLIEQMGGDSRERDMDMTRYAIAILHLQGKLLKNREMLDYLANGIERAKQQTEHFSLLHENVIANLAGLYSDTVSQLQPKIMVSGESQYLSNSDNANKIRALLLGGIRAGVLWNQLGGSRWQILFKRRRFVEQAQQILASSQPTLN